MIPKPEKPQRHAQLGEEKPKGVSALPHLPLVQWGERYPIGMVKVGHQHLQNVLNLQETKRGKTRVGGKKEVA